MVNVQLRKEIIAVANSFHAKGLGVGKSGNVSTRCDEGFLITPTGFPYSDLKPEDITYCNFEGDIIDGEWAPSSEWPFHAEIYKSRNDAQAIVHCHSPYATALACNRTAIPAFHYMVAVAGGKDIRCADYATFGTAELSKHVVKALDERKACLLANHGQVAVGASIQEAFKLAQEVESLAQQYCICLQTGKPVLLEDEEMATNLEKFKRYGKQQKT